MNDIVKYNTIIDDLDKINDEQFEDMFEIMLSKKVSRLENRFNNEIKLIKDDFTKYKEEVKIELDETKKDFERMKEDNDKTLEVAINGIRVQSTKYGYINQGGFGRCFGISIGAVTVGKFFRVVGLAQKSKKATLPMRFALMEDYVIIKPNEKYSAYYWNYEKCIDYIDKWLKNNELYEYFYAIENEKEMKYFIDNLYERYVGLN